jgi:hypothetical protein
MQRACACSGVWTVGGGQVGDQRATAGRCEDVGHRGREGVVHQALHVGYVHPAVVDQYPVRGASEGFQPDEPGHPVGGHVTVRGGHQQAFDGQQHRLQFGPRHQAGVTAPHVQPQAAIDLVEA